MGNPCVGVLGLGEGEYDELRGADLDELADQVGEPLPRRRHEFARIGQVRPPLGEQREESVGNRPERIRHEHAEMVVLDLAVVFGADVLDHGAARRCVGRGDERREPAVGHPADPTQLRWGDTAQPDLHLRGCRLYSDLVVVVAIAVVRERFAGPTVPHHGEHLVEQLGSFAPLHAEGLLFDRIDGAESERRQEATAGHVGQGGEFLGEHHRISAREHHHRHPEFQPLGAPCAVGHCHERVGRRPADSFRQPQRVETERFE